MCSTCFRALIPPAHGSTLQQALPLDIVDRGAIRGGVVVGGRRIQDVVLQHEGGVIGDADVAEGELDGVSRDAGPVALGVRVEGLLGDAEEAADGVEQDLPDAPAGGAGVAVVRDELRRVLDESDDELDVRERVHGVEPAPAPAVAAATAAAIRRPERHARRHPPDPTHAPRHDARHEPRRPPPQLRRVRERRPHRREVHARAQRREHQCVQRKGHVVGPRRRRQPVVPVGVLAADGVRVEEEDVGDEVT